MTEVKESSQKLAKLEDILSKLTKTRLHEFVNQKEVNEKKAEKLFYVYDLYQEMKA